MRNLLGKSLHSIQKFYSHSNWLELGNEHVLDLIWDDFGNVADEFESTCDDGDIIVDKLTSGYFPHNVSKFSDLRYLSMFFSAKKGPRNLVLWS